MTVVFFGLGSIGIRHAKILQKTNGCKLYAFRSGYRKSKNRLGIPEVIKWRELKAIRPDVSFITNPTSLHASTALKCARMGTSLFIEKPLDCSLSNVAALNELVRRKKLASYVAYVLRFHPVIQKLKLILKHRKPLHVRVVCSSHLFHWRSGAEQSRSYSRFNRMGGGVIYDLSHEFDYIQYLFGTIRVMKGFFGKRSRVTVDSEDYADILIKCGTVPVNLHLNLFSQDRKREITVQLSDKTLVADLIKSTIVEYKNGKVVRTTRFKSGIPECFTDQIRFFMRNRRNPRMMNNVSEASKLFKIIYAFKKKGSYDA